MGYKFVAIHMEYLNIKKILIFLKNIPINLSFMFFLSFLKKF